MPDSSHRKYKQQQPKQKNTLSVWKQFIYGWSMIILEDKGLFRSFRPKRSQSKVHLCVPCKTTNRRSNWSNQPWQPGSICQRLLLMAVKNAIPSCIYKPLINLSNERKREILYAFCKEYTVYRFSIVHRRPTVFENRP